MPTITNPGVISALVTAYLCNGMDKGLAALSVGYAQSTVRSANHTKLWERGDVKTELKKQQLDLIKKTGFTKEQAHRELDENRQLALELKQPSAATQASTAKIRLYGMDQVENRGESTVIIINPPNAKSVESEIINE